MNCQKCGSPLKEGDKFCSNCGTPAIVQKQNSVARESETVETPNPGTTYSDQRQTFSTGNSNTDDISKPRATYSDQRQAYPTRNSNTYETPGIQTSGMVQQPPFVVRRLPIFVIIVLTMGFLISSFIFEDGDADLAMILSCLPGIVLIFLIYKMDRIEPEPVGLMLKLFFAGACIATLVSGLIESFIGMIIDFLFFWDPVVYCFMEAFILAAATEELVKYFLLKKYTWKHPAFNYRFDGVVYSTMLALGFEIAENLMYIADSTLSTAFMRAAFPGHCVFGIYMGYYYGIAKSHELHGDLEGSKKLRKKGLIITILIHGGYDFLCMLGSSSENEIIQILTGLLLLISMVVLNVTAYKNIKKYAYYDSPV
ncbi:PrsW family glutamic-type intramembrane protease [Oribacterium sp. NK2B42]|uniref:PrsW family glutamic-type intramembrane protease n=1 Tax=Oribacterium sp. NK2B42 TaxID=689781 RepID=UPI0004927DD6|nr:PrsW family glutamic-type intramembrane protease [Oribacterium sp. NK2B42]